MNISKKDTPEALNSGMVGNPVIAQVRDFIDSDETPVALDPIGIARRALRGREYRVALLFVFAALLGAVCAYIAVSPIYQSSGVLRVLARESKILYADSDDSRLRLYDAFVAAEVELLQSRPVLEGALASLQASSDSLATVPDNVSKLAAMLGIEAKKGLVFVAVRSPDAALSAAAVNAVLAAYEASTEAARRRHYDVRRNELSARESELQATLATLGEEYLQIGGEHDIGTLSRAHVAKTAQLEVIEERIAELENTISQLNITGGVGADVGSVEIQRATLLDQATADMTYERARRMAALETLKSRYRPSHPKLRAAVGELAILESAIAERREQIATLGKAGALTGSGAGATQQSLDDLAVLKDTLIARRDATRNEAADLNHKLVRIGAIATEQKRLAELLEETKRALDEVELENQNDLSRSVEVIARGKVPEGAIEDKRKAAALGAAVFAGLGSFAITILGTLLGGRLRYSDDLDARATDLLAAVSPEECGSEHTLTAMRKLRNEFDLRWTPDSTEPFVIGVLGTQSGAGTTHMCSALGITYAAAGRRVLLIDADTASNGLSQLHAVEQEAGLIAVAQGSSTLAAAISPVVADGIALSLLAAPRSPDTASINGATLELAVDGMRRLLNVARADYDVIILDLGMLAAGRQSAVGAALAERVLLITASGTRRKYFDTAMARLDRLAPERFLLVLNRALPTDPAFTISESESDSGLKQPRHWLGQSIGYLKRRLQHE